MAETPADRSARELAENGAASIMARPEVLDYVCDYIRKGHMEAFALSQSEDVNLREKVYFSVIAVDAIKNTIISLSSAALRRRGAIT